MDCKKMITYLETHQLNQKVDIQTAYGSVDTPEQIRLSLVGEWKISAKEAAAIALALAGGASLRALRRLLR